jgi:hypothetical protein
MRRKYLALALGAVVLVAAGCKDQTARDSIADLKAKLTTHFQAQYDWGVKVRNALCQLETDVYDVKDSGNKTRTAGPATAPGSYRLCPDGPGDPVAGMPPKPPELGTT